MELVQGYFLELVQGYFLGGSILGISGGIIVVGINAGLLL